MNKQQTTTQQANIGSIINGWLDLRDDKFNLQVPLGKLIGQKSPFSQEKQKQPSKFLSYHVSNQITPCKCSWPITPITVVAR